MNDLTNASNRISNKKNYEEIPTAKRAITEVTISNIQNYHEGRIDALLEYPHGYACLIGKHITQ